MRRTTRLGSFLVCLASITAPAFAEPRVLRLEDAVKTGLEHQPSVLQARAQTDAAGGRYEQARSGYLPQVTGTASYTRIHSSTGTVQALGGPTTGTGGGAGQPAAVAGAGNYDRWIAQLSATQLIYDFGQTMDRMKAASATEDAQLASERTAQFQATLRIRQSFFQARTQRALQRVGEETVKNQERHVNQIEGYVGQGIRPEIDLVQARTDLANSRVTLINAQVGYRTAKATLNQAMGVAQGTDYEVAEETLDPVPGEEGNNDVLVTQALKARPEIAALEKQRKAAELTVASIQGAYGPSLSGNGTISEVGRTLDTLGLNWSVGVALNWPLFQGGLTRGQVREAKANVEVARAMAKQAELDVRLQVEQARLSVEAAKVVIGAAREALDNAKERLRLAEGRYENGVGNIIELDDAELATASAGAQLAQAEFSLASARAGLLSALGR